MSKVPAFIVNYNRLHLPIAMANYLADNDTGVDPIIIDNNSDYPPLLEYYKNCKHKVERMHLNYGNCALFTTGLLDKYNLKGNFILTDPDLDISSIPTDFLQVLQAGLDKYLWADKCGFSLEIKDLLNNELTEEVLKWEIGNWGNRLDNMYYKAAIDTTFALFRTRMHSFECLRTERPYTAKHMPWYWTKENIPEDERYYINSISANFNHYSSRIKNIIN